MPSFSCTRLWMLISRRSFALSKKIGRKTRRSILVQYQTYLVLCILLNLPVYADCPPAARARMVLKVGINGFGRIGRLTFRGLWDRYPNIQIIHVNEIKGGAKTSGV
jgi:hypothetical protein